MHVGSYLLRTAETFSSLPTLKDSIAEYRKRSGHDRKGHFVENVIYSPSSELSFSNQTLSFVSLLSPEEVSSESLSSECFKYQITFSFTMGLRKHSQIMLSAMKPPSFVELVLYFICAYFQPSVVTAGKKQNRKQHKKTHPNYHF